MKENYLILFIIAILINLALKNSIISLWKSISSISTSRRYSHRDKQIKILESIGTMFSNRRKISKFKIILSKCALKNWIIWVTISLIRRFKGWTSFISVDLDRRKTKSMNMIVVGMKKTSRWLIITWISWWNRIWWEENVLIMGSRVWWLIVQIPIRDLKWGLLKNDYILRSEEIIWNYFLSLCAINSCFLLNIIDFVILIVLLIWYIYYWRGIFEYFVILLEIFI